MHAFSDQARFDANLDEHHHLVCTKCRRVIDFEDSRLAALPVDQARLPDREDFHADLLGPVDLPAGVRHPAGSPAGVPVSRMLVRVRRAQGLALAAALRSAVGVLSARQDHEPVRVQIDPLHIG